MSKGVVFADRMARMRRSTIREILKLTKQPDMISFAGGLPAPELFPIEAFAEAVQKTLATDGRSSLQYDVTEGYAPLKEYLCGWLGRHGVPAKPENMMFTSGSQQALDLVGKVLLNPNDSILVEDPTYLGAIQSFNAYQARYLTAPMDNEGIEIAPAAKLLRKKPKFAYLVPTFQNPSGVTMTEQRRMDFLKIMRGTNIPIVEDDPYGYLRFHGKAAPSLYALAKGRGVIYMSTFSKILSPGIRLGFVLAPTDIIDALVLAKQAADLQPNSFIQRAVFHYAEAGHLDRHIPKIIEAYRERANVMNEAMKEHFPSCIEWVRPEGGMFVWCRLPKRVSATKLFKKAIAHKVAYVTGTVFHANGGGDNTFRMNFTNSSVEKIREGVSRLGQVLQEACG
jgi:2-aminoadipate transaminase